MQMSSSIVFYEMETNKSKTCSLKSKQQAALSAVNEHDLRFQQVNVFASISSSKPSEEQLQADRFSEPTKTRRKSTDARNKRMRARSRGRRRGSAMLAEVGGAPLTSATPFSVELGEVLPLRASLLV